MKKKLGAKNLAAKDPLMKKGHVKVANENTKKENMPVQVSDRIFQLTLLSSVPFFVYVFIVLEVLYRYYWHPIEAVTVTCITAGVALTQYMFCQTFIRRRRQQWKKWIGGLSLLATILAFMVGIYLHYEFMLFWRKYKTMMSYSNVAASQNALQFEDAGTITFTQGTTLDKTRAVGFRDIRNSKTLCVAPVIDGQMGQNDPITFFAVGVNCCGWRASFHCSDAAIQGAKSGLLKLPASALVTESLEWTVDGHFDFESFDKAVELLKSVFAVSTAENYRMVQWVKDPKAATDMYRKRGLEAAITSMALFLVIGVLLSCADLARETRKQARFAKAYISANGGAVDYVGDDDDAA